jgi:hypothetical protein
MIANSNDGLNALILGTSLVERTVSQWISRDDAKPTLKYARTARRPRSLRFPELKRSSQSHSISCAVVDSSPIQKVRI